MGHDPVQRMRHRPHQDPCATTTVRSPACDERFRARLGGRLLHAITGALVRLVDGIQRAFGLPPEATEDALKRFSARSGVKLNSIRAGPGRNSPTRVR